MGIMPISDWRTPASRIPEQSVSSCHVVKKIIKEGDALPMAGVFGYDRSTLKSAGILSYGNQMRIMQLEIARNDC